MHSETPNPDVEAFFCGSIFFLTGQCIFFYCKGCAEEIFFPKSSTPSSSLKSQMVRPLIEKNVELIMRLNVEFSSFS